MSRLRTHPKDRLGEPVRKIDLVEAAAALRAEPHAPVAGHRQIGLVRRGPVSLILFAFEADGFLKEHRADGEVVIQTLTGRLEVAAGGDVIGIGGRAGALARTGTGALRARARGLRHAADGVSGSSRAGYGVNTGAASAIAAAWILSLGFDVFLHGGLLARLYVQPSPFLLAPEEAFRRIPVGYLAFLGLTAALYWLLRRLGVRGAAAGFRYGAVAGAVVWGALAIGLYSISTAEPGLLAGWWVGQTVELGLAGAVLGAAGKGVSLKRIWTLVVVAVVIFAAATVALQSLGLAPPMKIAR